MKLCEAVRFSRTAKPRNQKDCFAKVDIQDLCYSTALFDPQNKHM